MGTHVFPPAHHSESTESADPKDRDTRQDSHWAADMFLLPVSVLHLDQITPGHQIWGPRGAHRKIQVRRVLWGFVSHLSSNSHSPELTPLDPG